MSTILHVEDDASLAELVQGAFEAFGFEGKTLVAGSLAGAKQVLRDLQKRGVELDLIISDMRLPDGDGLEVVRTVRDNPAWKHTPILMLSGDVDPATVGQAYSLGANCYIAKASRGRSTAEVVRTLYDHWMKDVVLPPGERRSPLHTFLGTGIAMSNRYGAFYMDMVEHFAGDSTASEFWLNRALDEGNLVNLLAFLQRQADALDLPDEIVEGLQETQRDAIGALTQLEADIRDHPIDSPDEAYARLLDYVAILRPERYAPAITYLFPRHPATMMAARDMLAQHREDIAAWISAHTDDRVLLARIAHLEYDIASLRALPHPSAKDAAPRAVRTPIETPR